MEEENLYIPDVCCNYIDILGDIALIKRDENQKWAEHMGVD